MKKYQKAELIAKNLPTGSYAAGCPAYLSQDGQYHTTEHLLPGTNRYVPANCVACECTK